MQSIPSIAIINVYTLDLPARWRIFPKFHVSLLKKTQPPELEQEFYIIDKILGQRYRGGGWNT